MDQATMPPESGRPTPKSVAAPRSEPFPRVTVDELDGDGRDLRRAILDGPRRQSPGQFEIEAADGTLEGPFGLFLFAPAVGAPLQELGARLRTASSLSARERELAILAIAAELGSDFELRAHLPIAAAAGLDDDVVTAVLAGRWLDDPREDALVRFCRANAVVAQPRSEFAELAFHFDRRAVFEVMAFVTYYRGLASMLALFAIEPPAGTTAPPISPVRTTETAELARDVAQLREEREISRLLIALARSVDTFDFVGLASLYAEDGELVTPWGSHRGREGLAEYVGKDIGVYRALHHVSAGHEIWVVPGAPRARARMTLLATHVTDDAGRAFSTAGGHYDVELVREHGAWRLARVQIVPAWFFDSTGKAADDAK